MNKSRVFLWYFAALIVELIPGSVVQRPGWPVHDITIKFSYFSIEHLYSWNLTPLITFVLTTVCAVLYAFLAIKKGTKQKAGVCWLAVISILASIAAAISAVLNFNIISICICIAIVIPTVFSVIYSRQKADMF